jgi:hypothetical protein
MAIAVTSPGPNTVQITTSNDGGVYSDQTDLFQAVSDAITGVNPVRTTGWALHDSFTVGTTLTQVFKGINKDNTTYKNIILRWDTVRHEIITSTCEVWDAINHIPQNEAWTFFNSCPISYQMAATDLLLMLNPRWLILHSYMANEPGSWAGVVETAREDVADTAAAAVPCWGWVSSNLWMLGATSTSSRPLPSVSASYPLMCVPRTRTGFTTTNAAINWSADYGATQYPHWLANTGGAFIYYLGNQQNKFVANSWDVTKRMVLPIKPIAEYMSANITNYGQMFGLKVVSPAGLNMNKIQVNTDADGNYSPAATVADHWLLNNHHKYMSADNASWFTNVALVRTDVTIGYRPEFVCSVGDHYYVTNGVAGSRIGKVNILLGTYTNITNAYAAMDLQYDGERYVYVCHTSGILRIDTRNNDAQTNLAISNGTFTLALTPTHIVTTPYNASTTPVITRILRSTFAVDATNGSLTLATFTESVRLTDAVGDAEGNIHIAGPVATAGNFKMVKIPYATPASIVYSTLDQIVCANVGFQFLDENNMLCWKAVTSGQMRYLQFNPKTMAQVAVGTISTFSALTNQHKLSCARIAGVLKVLARGSGTTTYSSLLSLGTTCTTSLGTPVLSVDLYGATNMTYASANSMMFWDGARLVSNTETQLRWFTNMNGVNIYNGQTVGQATIPA